jgi:hypothetical protein
MHRLSEVLGSLLHVRYQKAKVEKGMWGEVRDGKLDAIVA